MASSTPPRQRLRRASSVTNPTTALPQLPKPQDSSEQLNKSPPDSRRTSFNFLRKESKMSKKQKAQRQEELLRQQRQENSLPKQPPQLPSHSPLPTINTFGGEDARPDSVAIATGQYSHQARRTPSQGSLYARSINFSRPSPMPTTTATGKTPPVPGNDGEYVDPYPRTESMTHRGRYSYASSAMSTINSPRRVRRRKDPTPFNILVIGAKNSGKTSFINFLRTALALPDKKRQHSPEAPRNHQLPVDTPFTSEYIETDIDNERVGVTIWDSQGLEKNIVDLQLREMAAFLESKFEETFTEEQKVVRSLGVWDTYIHCAFLILDPGRLDSNVAAAARNARSGGKFGHAQRLVGGLDDDLDLEVLRTLQGKTTVIPVISKADTITTKHMAQLKKMVWGSLKQAKLDPLEALDLDDEESDTLEEQDEEDEDLTSSDADEAKSTASVKPKDSSIAEENEAGSDGEASEVKRPTHARKVSAMSATLATSPSTTDTELPYLPMSIISPDLYEPEVIGRQFPWGFADPYNTEHCDFIRLKESIFREWRIELRAASRERWYEDWRTSRLNRSSIDTPRRVQTGDGSRRSPAGGSLMPLPNGAVRATSAGGYSSENSKPAQYQAYRPSVPS